MGTWDYLGFGLFSCRLSLLSLAPSSRKKGLTGCNTLHPICNSSALQAVQAVQAADLSRVPGALPPTCNVSWTDFFVSRNQTASRGATPANQQSELICLLEATWFPVWTRALVRPSLHLTFLASLSARSSCFSFLSHPFLPGPFL